MRALLPSTMLLLAMACAAEPEAEPTPDPITGPDRSLDIPADAVPCGTEQLCFSVAAPIDRNDPEGEQISIYSAVLPSTSDEPEGVLFLNFGGFGSPGTPMLEGYASGMPELRERYDLVSWDPRGSGQSETLDCAKDYAVVFQATGPVSDLSTAEAHIDARAEIVDACRQDHGAMIDHMGFLAHASDLDAVRRAVGVDEIDYAGFSAGTTLGQTYAHVYGEHVGRMVLDSAMPGQGGSRTLLSYQAPAVVEAIEDFQRWCDSVDCALDDADATIREVLDQAAAGTLPAGPLSGPVSWNDAGFGIIVLLYSPANYAFLESTLVDALAGDGSVLQALGHSYFGRSEGQNSAPWHTVYQLTNCSGETTPTDADDVLAAHLDYDQYSGLGPVYATDHAWCAAIGEGVDPIRETQSAPDVGTPILILQSRIDFATPLAAAEEMHAQLDDSRLVVYEGAGHIASVQSACMRSYLVQYLVDGVVPDEGSTCGQ